MHIKIHNCVYLIYDLIYFYVKFNTKFFNSVALRIFASITGFRSLLTDYLMKKYVNEVCNVYEKEKMKEIGFLIIQETQRILTRKDYS